MKDYIRIQLNNIPTRSHRANQIEQNIYQSKYDDIVAIGGELSLDNLRYAYKNGIFPWYNEPPILWWSPNPRFVLFVDDIYINRTLRKAIQQIELEMTFNKRFKDVIYMCSKVERGTQESTWINKDIMLSYIAWNQKYQDEVISVEAWCKSIDYIKASNTGNISYKCIDGKNLVAGFYGVKIGKVFSGESMFSIVDNASKILFVSAVAYLKENYGIELVDCQQYSQYMASLGAKYIPRDTFLNYIK